MSIFSKILGRKEKTAQEAREKLELQYREIKRNIEKYEKEKERCIQEASECPPDSFKYKDCERAYQIASDALTLQYKALQQYTGLMDAAEKEKMMKDYENILHQAAKSAKQVLADAVGAKKRSEKIQQQEDELQARLDIHNETNQVMFTPAEEKPRDSAFAQAVAQNQRRQAQLEMAGADISTPVSDPPEAVSEFKAKTDALRESSETDKKE